MVGSKLSGKTTFIEILKNSSVDVQPINSSACSSGLQVIQLTLNVGEVAFFELPCDPTQAAVVEILTSASNCSAIVVININGKEASEVLGYWLSLLSCSCKCQVPLEVTVVGNHSDILEPAVDVQEVLRQVR